MYMRSAPKKVAITGYIDMRSAPPPKKKYTRSAPKKVAIIGSGNWGSAMAKIIGKNCARLEHLDTEVRICV